MKMTMTDAETDIFTRKERVFRRIKELILRHGIDQKLRYPLPPPHNDSDLTIRQQAEMLRQLHEEAAIEITKQNIDWIEFQIIKDRFDEIAAVYDKNTWDISRAARSARIQKLIAPIRSERPISSAYIGTVKATAPRAGKPLQPPLDWDDTPYSKREKQPSGLIIGEDGLMRIVYSGSHRVEFDGQLRCRILDFLYMVENRDNWHLASSIASAVDAVDNKEVRDAVEGINKRVNAFTIIGERQRNEKINAEKEYRWAL